MKLFCITAILILSATRTVAQSEDTNCHSNYLFVKNWIEKNSASFNDNIKGNQKLLYARHCDSIQELITANPNKDCLSLLQSYLSFFQDNHLSVSVQFNDADTNQLKLFYQSPDFLKTKVVNLTSTRLQELEKIDAAQVEGIYLENGNDFYKVAVVKIDNNQYSGIIINSKTPLWKNSQVKFDFTFEDDTTITYTLYNRKHQPETGQGKFTHANLTGLNYRKSTTNPYSDNSHLYDYKLLNDSTCYLKLSSFGGWLYKELDSFYTAIRPVVSSKPYLIIDIRNNGGGADVCYEALKPLFYTNPIESDIVDILATPENLARYQNELKMMMSDSATFGADAIKEKKREITVMKKTKSYHFAKLQSKQYFFLKTLSAYPKKIALVFNSATASSAEDLIFDAQQSKKVVTIGENSSGYTGYGNVYEVSIPNSNMTFTYSTTRYRIQKRYDGIGFSPMYKVGPQENVIERAMEVLRRRTAKDF
jgi:hypothetical protein